VRITRRILIPICCLLALLGLSGPGHTSGPPSLVRVRIAYQQRDELARLEQAGVDIWEVHPGYAVAVVSGAQEEALIRQGYELERLGSVSPLFAFDPQYHTYQEMVVKLQSLAGAYPDLLRLVSVGQSWETVQGRADRELWALRIRSDPEGADARPKVLFVAALHARELATVEVALKLAAYLLESYLTDADVAYLLDTRETWVVPMANPDGHIHAEEGQSWRKNTNDSEGPCSIPPNSYGVDLNRNFPYQWGGIGSGSDPCDLTYRGSGPLSEPEDHALANLIQEQGFGLTVSYHSYGEMILYPWGYTTSPPSDEELLAAIAEKMASHNGYRWGQSSEILYRTNGDLADWAYQEVGALSFTVELGPSYYTCRQRCFDPPYSSVEGLWQENREPALYLLKIADDANLAYGPEATDVALVTASRNLTLTAVLSDGYNGGEDIAAAELFVDVLGEPGTGWALAPADGAFDSPQEQVIAILPWPEPGRHTLYLRGQDAEGHWGPVSAAFWEGHRSFMPIAIK
jgi:carboxypeptidase T